METVDRPQTDMMQIDSSSSERRRQLSPLVIAGSGIKTFFANEPFQLAAALSYYSLLSLAPLLLVITGIFGLLLDEDWFQAQIISQVEQLVGSEGAATLRTVITATNEADDSGWSLLIGFALSILGATTVFAQLQAALNRIFEVKPRVKSAVGAFVRARLISFTVVLGVGFLMLVSLTASAVVNGLQEYAADMMLGAPWFWQIVNVVLAFVLLTVFIGMLFRYVPDVELAWQDTWIGAATTALLFSIGKHAIGLYLGTTSVGSAFGAAGSAVVFMVWIYYASLILFLGAAITQVVANQPVVADSAREEPEEEASAERSSIREST